MGSVQIAETDGQIAACFQVMQQLRTDVTKTEFLPRVRRQQAGGYQLAYLELAGEVCAVAGFRVIDNLVGGRILYLDDLVTDGRHRSRGHGKALFSWLVQRGKEERCRYLELDSGVQRFDAHRFYQTNRMIIAAHHFELEL